MLFPAGSRRNRYGLGVCARRSLPGIRNATQEVRTLHLALGQLDELRGGMDASQHKDYALVLLFIKYASDKYTGVRYAPITVPVGSSLKSMVALKGKASIGDVPGTEKSKVVWQF